MLNRKAFFDHVRKPLFGGSLTASQVAGIGAILDRAEAANVAGPALAYVLATAYHETARTMQPIREYGGTDYFHRMYDIKGARPAKARELGNLAPGDGARYAGRGYVQLTGKSNYARAERELDRDLVGNPDLAMDPGIAAEIAFRGMAYGWFTGRKLSDYFTPTRADPVNARRIINGLDKAEQIAGHYRHFLAALDAAAKAPAEPARPLPPPPPSTARPTAPSRPAAPGSPSATPPPKPEPMPSAGAARQAVLIVVLIVVAVAVVALLAQ